MHRHRLSTAIAAAFAALSLAACGEKDESAAEITEAAPQASAFPQVENRSLDQLLSDYQETDDLVVAPAGQVFSVGRDRFGFGVFQVDRTQITDAEVAIYAQSADSDHASGPYPARVESLETEPAFTARNTAADPDAAKAVYVTDLLLDRPGEWQLLALIRRGDEYVATRIPSIVAARDDRIPAVGEPAPNVHTPTADDVGGDLAKIDTRIPPDTMHADDLADVLGKKPVVLLFATPALCQSRVCGPVVDVAEQVKRDLGEDAAFIHMEIYNDNLANKGLREQVRAYHLPTEPWLFVIDCKGRVDTRIEGAFSVGELSDAVERVSNSC